jgi:hypothetical protein
LCEVCLGLIEGPLRLLDQGFVLPERRLEIACVHHCDDLAGLHHVPFVGQQLEDAPGEFGVDIDLVRFEAPVAPGDAGRQPRPVVHPPIADAEPADQHGEHQQGGPDPALSALRDCRRRHDRRQRGRGRGDKALAPNDLFGPGIAVVAGRHRGNLGLSDWG